MYRRLSGPKEHSPIRFPGVSCEFVIAGVDVYQGPRLKPTVWSSHGRLLCCGIASDQSIRVDLRLFIPG